jgi:hypothetical protein
MKTMGLTSKGLERAQAVRKGERFGFRTGMTLRTVYTENLSRNSPGFEYVWKSYPLR